MNYRKGGNDPAVLLSLLGQSTHPVAHLTFYNIRVNNKRFKTSPRLIL